MLIPPFIASLYVVVLICGIKIKIDFDSLQNLIMDIVIEHLTVEKIKEQLF